MPDGSLPDRRRFDAADARGSLILPLAGAAVCFLALPFVGPADEEGAPIRSLQATASMLVDHDGDGLTDAQEFVLGTYPYYWDSDDDGYTDSEEIARHSDPLDFVSVPQSSGVSVGLTAHGTDGYLKVVMCVYEPSNMHGESLVRFGALRDGRVVTVPMARIFGFADVFESSAMEGARVITTEIPINPAFVTSVGRATFFAAAADQATLTYQAASKVDVTSSDGVLLLQRASNAQGLAQSGLGGGSIRQPIPIEPGSSTPVTWTAGAVCFQRSTVVGGNGAVMLHEVVEADCLGGWDSYCPSDCSGEVGTTFETVDPAALLGG
ncbi:MAG: thrombospondin type 3 repeat-containing protein [Planctomycetota bacterium]